MGIAAPTDPLNLPDVGPLSASAVASQPLVVALPSGHPLGSRSGLRLGDLASARWIDAPDVAIPLSQLGSACRADGFRPAFGYSGTDVRSLLMLVSAGHGLAVLPALPGVFGVPVVS